MYCFLHNFQMTLINAQSVRSFNPFLMLACICHLYLLNKKEFFLTLLTLLYAYTPPLLYAP
jgi:hypothetical protein